jgi:type IV secretion system protein VirD4
MSKGNKAFLATLALSFAAGLVAATQYVAAELGYQPALGRPWLAISGTPVYAPWSFVDWYASYSNRAPQIFDLGGLIFVSATFVPFLMAVGLTRRNRPLVREFGADAWGTLHDAKKAGIIADPPRGTCIGQWHGRVLSYSGPEHQLVTGASRAGKGVGHVVPTLLLWPESALIYDPKAELFDITGHFRQQFTHAFFLNFTRTDSACFNPLFEIRKGPKEIGDIQNVVAILIDPTGSKNSLTFWDQAASELLTAVILHVLYAMPDKRKNLAILRDCLLDLDGTLAAMAGTYHRHRPDYGQPDGLARDKAGEPIPEIHPECLKIANEYMTMERRQRNGIQKTASATLVLYADPLVAEKTSRSDFCIADLVCSDHPVTCYLQIPPSDASRLKPLTRLILSQVAQSLMEEIGHAGRGRQKKHRLLYLIDEFPTLGRLDFFTTNMRVMAGYGIKALLVVQSFKDIADTYGHNSTIVDNCHITVAFASADDDTQRKISTMAGTAVEYRESISRPAGMFARGYATKSISEVQRPLLAPGDVRMLSYDKQLIFVTGSRPMLTEKLRYYEHPLFRSRATDIRASKRGPDQVAQLDVPARRAVQVDWFGVKPVRHYIPSTKVVFPPGMSAPIPDGVTSVADVTGAEFAELFDSETDETI